MILVHLIKTVSTQQTKNIILITVIIFVLILVLPIDKQGFKLFGFTAHVDLGELGVVGEIVLSYELPSSFHRHFPFSRVTFPAEGKLWLLLVWTD